MVATFSHAVADTPTKVVIDVRGTSEEPPPHLRVLSAAFALNLNATIALGTAISVTSDQQVHVELACLVGLLTVDMVTVPLAVNASEIARHAVMPKHTGTRLELRGPASLVRTLLATTEYSGVEAGSDRVRITMDEEEEEEILIWLHLPVTAGATRGAPARVGGQGLQFYGKVRGDDFVVTSMDGKLRIPDLLPTWRPFASFTGTASLLDGLEYAGVPGRDLITVQAATVGSEAVESVEVLVPAVVTTKGDPLSFTEGEVEALAHTAVHVQASLTVPLTEEAGGLSLALEPDGLCFRGPMEPREPQRTAGDDPCERFNVRCHLKNCTISGPHDCLTAESDNQLRGVTSFGIEPCSNDPRQAFATSETAFCAGGECVFEVVPDVTSYSLQGFPGSASAAGFPCDGPVTWPLDLASCNNKPSCPMVLPVRLFDDYDIPGCDRVFEVSIECPDGFSRQVRKTLFLWQVSDVVVPLDCRSPMFPSAKPLTVRTGTDRGK